MNWKELGLSFVQRFAIEALMKYIGGELKSIPMDRINLWMVHLGMAFGPAGIRHFSELSIPEQTTLLNRVPVLRGNHTDWLKPFQWVPRRLTVWVGPEPKMEDVLDGQVTELKPLPNHGEWYVLRGYMASTTEEGIHNRFGWRWDDIDRIWVLSLALKIVG